VSTVLRERVKLLVKLSLPIAISSALFLTALAYAIDSIVFRYRLSTNRQPYGQFTVNSYDAVQQKNGKTEFLFNPPEAQTCVHALFPHDAFVPCWYLRRHTEQRTNI
jgi:hypothetical protein